MKVTIVSVVPSPYQRDLFQALSRQPGIELQVFYLEAAAPDSPWPQASLQAWETILPGHTLGTGRVRCHFNWRMPTFDDADIVIINALITDWTTQELMRRLNRQAKPWVFWGECLRKRTGMPRLIQDQLVRPLRKASAVVAIGTQAHGDFQSRLPNVRCEELPYHCQINSFLSIPRTKATKKVTFLFCGQMIERKGIDILLGSFQKLRSKHPEARLLIAGRGQPVAQDGVEYRGFVAPENLPELFAEADVFVLPSRHDGWGVVINQALAAGLPIIATDAVGAASDLVTSGKQGLIIPPCNSRALQDAMLTLLTNPQLRQRQSDAARHSGKELDPDHGAARWSSILTEVTHPNAPALTS